MILVINKVDRPDARVAEVIDEVYELFLDLDADESQIEFPIVYCNAKAGVASLEYDESVTRAAVVSGNRAGAGGSGADGAGPRRVRGQPSAKGALRRCSTCCSSTSPRRPTARPPAAGARDQSRRLPLRGAPGDLPRASRHDQKGPADRLVPRRWDDLACAGRRAVCDRGARSRRRGTGRAGGDHRRGRDRRGHDRRDARRPG